jgi:lipoprotein-anchoring transpeptidase ErfK/SrfK
MLKTVSKIIIASMLLFLFVTESSANYYTELRKLEKKIYILTKQQKLLAVRLEAEEKKFFNAGTVRAYREKIASIHNEALQYEAMKKDLIQGQKEQEAYERKMEKQLDSIPGDIYVAIDLGDQMMKVYKGDTIVYSWLCSTGRRGYDTPRGSFAPYHAVKMHHSKQWDDAPMPYSVFFNKGVAVHGTNHISRLGRKASHGCVRLHVKHAKKFYKLARKYGYRRIHIDVT